MPLFLAQNPDVHRQNLLNFLKQKCLIRVFLLWGCLLKVLRRQHSMFSEFKSTMEPTILFVS
nr:MAG TPA: hypothetical protein [Caudoviricetes sp.]DAZ17610.1 MAG TPA: hypothetical protein [Caudoviricetes sp.]